MQSEKKERGPAATQNDAQAVQAALCRTTVISGADAYEDRTERLIALVKDLGHRGRFDLLTVPQPEKLGADPRLFDQVAKDAALAIKLHHGEQIVVAIYGDPDPIVAALRERPEFQGGGVAVSGLDLRRPGRAQPPPAASTVAVTCMDFRQHDADLPRRLAEAYGLSGLPAVLAMAGGAKDLVAELPRGRRIVQRLKLRARTAPISKLVLTCHTDCGAMGGDAAPAFRGGDGRPDPKRQIRVLQDHLRASAAFVKATFPEIEISTGIVRLKDGRIDAVVPYGT